MVVLSGTFRVKKTCQGLWREKNEREKEMDSAEHSLSCQLCLLQSLVCWEPCGFFCLFMAVTSCPGTLWLSVCGVFMLDVTRRVRVFHT